MCVVTLDSVPRTPLEKVDWGLSKAKRNEKTCLWRRSAFASFWGLGPLPAWCHSKLDFQQWYKCGAAHLDFKCSYGYSLLGLGSFCSFSCPAPSWAKQVFLWLSEGDWRGGADLQCRPLCSTLTWGSPIICTTFGGPGDPISIPLTPGIHWSHSSVS